MPVVADRENLSPGDKAAINKVREQALKQLREARSSLLIVKNAMPSREIAVAITECETAILWLRAELEAVNQL